MKIIARNKARTPPQISEATISPNQSVRNSPTVDLSLLRMPHTPTGNQARDGTGELRSAIGDLIPRHPHAEVRGG